MGGGASKQSQICLGHEIYCAVKLNDIKKLSALLEQENKTQLLEALLFTYPYDEKKLTSFLYAARCGFSECVDLLLNAGVSPEQRDADGSTAIILASYLGRNECISRLIEAGADFETKDSKKENALMKAAMNGLPTTVKILLKAGAKPNIQNGSGKTALQLAKSSVGSGKADCIKILKRVKYDI